ncbi:MAG: DUF1347 family protein [Chlamydiales bacterium]|nr:DUF1347 family protein [Chlamydiales bacterium]
MAYVKASILTIFVLIALLLGYMFLAFDSDYSVHMAYESFLKGDNAKAGKELASLKDALPREQLELYQAYVARSEKRLDESQRLLESAGVLAQQHQAKNVLLEIRLNQALNAYLLNNAGALKSAVDKAAQASPNQPWVVFFQGLQSYQDGDYAKALEFWSIPGERIPLSGWMNKAFDTTFSRLWIVTHLARCQIEQGKELLARQTLEEETEHATEAEMIDVNFLLGLSYAKEAEGKTPTTAAPYWKLAFSYLSKVPAHNERYQADLQRLSTTVQKLVNSLIESRLYSDLPFYSSMLQTWGAENALNEIATAVIAHLNQAVTESNWRRVEELATLLNRMLPEGSVRQELQKRFQALAYQALEDTNYDQVAEYWFVANNLSNKPDELTAQFANKMADKIVQLLQSDDEKLTMTTSFLNMWGNIQKNPAERTIFAKKIIEVAGDLWLQPQGDKKAQALIKLALEISRESGQEEVKKTLQETITKVYDEANKRDASEKLPSILEAIHEYKLADVDVKGDSQIERHLTAARDLMRQSRYDEALSRAEWVLRLKPEDQAARLIAGMVYYNQADYQKAREYLEKVPTLNPQEKEALAVSQIMTGDSAAGSATLVQLQGNNALNDDTLLRIALGLLTEGRAQDAVAWLNKISTNSPEITIGKAYANFLLGKYSEVSPLLRTVGAPYSALDGVRGLAIQADIASGSVDSAEKALIKLLNQTDQPPLSGMSPAFQNFVRQKLSEFGRYYMAGLFFKNVKKNDTIAAKYFQLIKDPTPMIRVVRGESFLAANQVNEALADLTIAATQEADKHAQRAAIPVLAAVMYRKQEYLEASELYKKYYASNPTTVEYRGAYARLLMKLRRFDVASQQYAAIGDAEKFSPEDTVGLAECLFHLDRWEDASKVGEFFLQKPSQPLEQQLAMARVMAKVENFRSTWPLLKTLPPVSKLTIGEARELMEFLMEIGAFAQASSVATEKTKELENDVESLLVLAKLNEQLSRYADALTFARLARALQPDNLDVYAALGRYARDIPILETLVSELEKRADQDPENTSLRVAYARQLADLGNWARVTEDRGAARYQAEYQKAAFLLEKTLGVNGDVPEIRNVLGQLLALMNKPTEAVAAYRAAIQLDPSYSSAYMGLAREYKQAKDDRSAIRALFLASHYEPSNAEAWQRLADLYKQQGDLYEASHFYQNALKHNPNNVRLYLALGQVLLELRNPEDAQVLLAHAVEIAPKNAAILKLLLQTLYDPLLVASIDDVKLLVNQQKQVYELLHSVDATSAEKFIADINEKRRGAGEDFPSVQDTPIFSPSTTK